MMNGRRLLMINKYTYKMGKPSLGGVRWHCSSYAARRCMASAVIRDEMVESLRYEHNHAPPEFFVNVYFLKSRNGKPLLGLGNYTYRLQAKQPKSGKILWICSRSSTCLAKVHTVESQVIFINNNHTTCLQRGIDPLRNQKHHLQLTGPEILPAGLASSLQVLLVSNKPAVDPPGRILDFFKQHVMRKIVSVKTKKFVRRACRVCSANNKRGDTSYTCVFCKVPLHMGKCFEEYHTKKEFGS